MGRLAKVGRVGIALIIVLATFWYVFAEFIGIEQYKMAGERVLYHQLVSATDSATSHWIKIGDTGIFSLQVKTYNESSPDIKIEYMFGTQPISATGEPAGAIDSVKVSGAWWHTVTSSMADSGLWNMYAVNPELFAMWAKFKVTGNAANGDSTRVDMDLLQTP